MKKCNDWTKCQCFVLQVINKKNRNKNKMKLKKTLVLIKKCQ